MLQRKPLIPVLLALTLFSCSKGAHIPVWSGMAEKIERMRTAETRYEALEREHAELKKRYFALEHEYESLRAEVESKDTAERNLKLAGSPSGRSLASIPYKVPENLNMDQRYALAFEHMREKRFAEAAATFESFLSEPEGASQQTANAFYTAGVAWFKLENYKKARQYFEVSLQKADGEERAKIHHKVELWMRVLDKKGARHDP